MKHSCRYTSGKSCGRVHRRTFLETIAAGSLGIGLSGCGSALWPDDASVYEAGPRIQAPLSSPSSGPLALPGPFPGRVIEVGHAGSIRDGRRDRDSVRAMVEFGMTQLVPAAESAVDAWRYFFQPGDRVGIKVVPVGMAKLKGLPWTYDGVGVDLRRPGSISSYELVHEVVNGLESAGVRRRDVMVFERYRRDFIRAGYVASMPDGVHWECCSADVDAVQLEIDGQIRGQPRRKNVAGYDRDVYRELPFCQPAKIHDPQDDRRFRSHVTKIVTQKVDKIISLPVLKDHQSAGVTLALKNMSHGLVNNVARSHVVQPNHTSERGGTLNHCQTFIPAAVSLPPIREKCVLQILDGLLGTYQGGPGSWNQSFATWEYKSLLFATDPVALDHVGWQILDAKRAQVGWPRVAEMGHDGQTDKHPTDGSEPDNFESFHIRQPQHVPLASLLGLGTFDQSALQHERFDIG